MPRQNAQPELTLFDQIQQLQSSIGNDYNDFTEEDRAALEDYSNRSRQMNFQTDAQQRNDPENDDLKPIAQRLATLVAHHPKNSPALDALREHIPDIGKLRQEKMEALRTDASRAGMDKLLNDFLGSKKRAAKEELERIYESRQQIDGRDRSVTVKAPDHAGKGRNVLSSITNASGLGTYDQRHNTDAPFEDDVHISFQTKNGILDGAKFSPASNPTGKVVLVFSGSGSPAEEFIGDIAEEYNRAGATVVVFNYRGFGQSKTLDKNGNQIGTPLSEQSIYQDGMDMYKYVRDVMGVSPENIILHGYSLGGAVASHVAANVAEQNKLKMDKEIPVPDSRKLGGIVLQSPIESMYSAARGLGKSPVTAYIGSMGSGEYNTRENMRRLFQNDPTLPVLYISGTAEENDHLSLNVTNLHQDTKAPFPNASCSIAECGHNNLGEMLQEADDIYELAANGRNAQLNAASIPGREAPVISNPAEVPQI